MLSHYAFKRDGFLLGILIFTAGLTSSTTYAAFFEYLPDAGGNWSTCTNWNLGRCPGTDDVAIFGYSTTVNKTVDLDVTPPLILNSLTLDGYGARFAMLLQTSNTLITEIESISLNAPAWHWMEGDAYTWVMGDLNIGAAAAAEGHFHLDCVASYGLLVSDWTEVGLHGAGDFDHLSGGHYCHGIRLGTGGPGTYWLKGPTEASTLTVEGRVSIGGDYPGLFEQTGGTFKVIEGDFLADLYVGWPGAGDGTYKMKGGVLESDAIRIGCGASSEFIHSGGSVTAVEELGIGCGSGDPNATYTLNEDDAAATLNINGDMSIGIYGPGIYHQTAGTATIDESLNIATAGEVKIDGGTFTTPLAYNDGNITVSGGEFKVAEMHNNTTQSLLLWHGAMRTAKLYNLGGRVELWHDTILSGPSAGGGLYYLCELLNDAQFEMGDDTFDGGTFAGILTNNGGFTYWHGDFSTSTLINHGVFNHFSPFSCRRLENHADIISYSGEDITVDGAGYTYAVENYGTLKLYPNAPLTLTGGKPLLNEGTISAGATLGENTTITGDVINKGLIKLSHLSNATGNLNLNGDFACSNDAELQVRLAGTAWASEHDRLTIQGAASLAGTLNVTLLNNFSPAIGDRFGILRFGSRSGSFNEINLPTLSGNRGWRTSTWANGLTLIVALPGDFDGDGEVNQADFVKFEDCMNGPHVKPHPYQTTADQCLAAFDFETDYDVDATDFATFQTIFTGS